MKEARARASFLFSGTIHFLQQSFKISSKQENFLQNCDANILAHIFSFLNAYDLRCAVLVSRHWRRIAEDESLWYYILKNEGNLSEDEITNFCQSVPSNSSKNSQDSVESITSAVSSALSRGKDYYRKKCISLLKKDSPEYQRANKPLERSKSFWSRVFEGKNTTLVVSKKKQGNLNSHLADTQKKFMTGAAVNYKQAVALPTGENLEEWIAVNTIDFYNQIRLLYGTVSEKCGVITCPVMNAGPKFEYLWADGISIKKPIKVSAAEYVNLLFEWAEKQMNDENLFPTTTSSYPSTFKDIAKKLLKRFFRVYAHIYHSHYNEIVLLGEESSLNCSSKHFIYFVREFDLMHAKELEPLQDLINNWDDNEKKITEND